MRALALAAFVALLAGCQALMGGGRQWDEWSRLERLHPRLGAIGAASDVIEHRESWRGPADLSGDFLLAREGTGLTLLAEMTDDRPLQQWRRERHRPRWWLMPVGSDAVELLLRSPDGGEDVSVIAALGSGGVGPQILGGGVGDEIEVWPTMTGARVRLFLELNSRPAPGIFTWPVEVRVHDFDGPSDWSVHRTPLR